MQIIRLEEHVLNDTNSFLIKDVFDDVLASIDFLRIGRSLENVVDCELDFSI